MAARRERTASLQTTRKIAATLQSLLQNLEQASEADKVAYKGFYGWCNEVYADRKSSEKHYSGHLEYLTTQLAAQQAANNEVKDEIEEMDSDIDEAQKAISEATNMQQSEHKDYLAQQQELVNIIALVNQGATEVARSPTEDTLTVVANSVLELAKKSAMVSDAQRKQLLPLSQPVATDEGSQAVIEAERAQRGVLLSEVLSGLIVTFQAQEDKLMEQERRASTDYSKVILVKKQSVSRLTRAKHAKDAVLAEGLQKLSQVQRSLKDLKDLSIVSGKHSQDLEHLCSSKSAKWTARSNARSSVSDRLFQVVKTLSHAVNDTTSDPALVQASSAKHKHNNDGMSLLQTNGLKANRSAVVHSAANKALQTTPGASPAAPSFLQIGAEQTSVSDADPGGTGPLSMVSPDEMPQSGQQLVITPATVVKPDHGIKHHDSAVVLRQMLQHVSSQGAQAQKDEEKHRQWCTDKVAENKATLTEKSMRLKELSARLDRQQDAADEFHQDVQEFGEEANRLQADFKKMQQLVAVEDDNYNKATHNDKIASEILNKSASILSSFDTLQLDPQVQVPSGFLKARDDHKSGALLMLAIDGISQVLDKYDQLRKILEQSQSSAQLDANPFVQEHHALVGVLNETKRHTYSMQVQLENSIASAQSDQHAMQLEVDADTNYMQQLQDACRDVLGDYAERRQLRQDDMKALERAAEEAMRTSSPLPSLENSQPSNLAGVENLSAASIATEPMSLQAEVSNAMPTERVLPLDSNGTAVIRTSMPYPVGTAVLPLDSNGTAVPQAIQKAQDEAFDAQAAAQAAGQRAQQLGRAAQEVNTTAPILNDLAGLEN